MLYVSRGAADRGCIFLLALQRARRRNRNRLRNFLTLTCVHVCLCVLCAPNLVYLDRTAPRFLPVHQLQRCTSARLPPLTARIHLHCAALRPPTRPKRIIVPHITADRMHYRVGGIRSDVASPLHRADVARCRTERCSGDRGAHERMQAVVWAETLQAVCAVYALYDYVVAGC